MSDTTPQSVSNGCRKYVKSRIDFNNFNTFINVTYTTTMNITTKFSIGDELFAIDKKTAKAVKFKVGRIFVHVTKEGVSKVEYFGEDMLIFDGSYAEDVCFATIDELIEQVKSGISI